MFVNGDASVELEISRREFFTEKVVSIGKLNFRQCSRLYIILQLSHGHDSSPTQSPFFIGHAFHSQNVCSSLVTVDTNVFLCLEYHAHAFLGFFPVVTVDFYLRPGVSVNFIRRVHCQSRQYITLMKTKYSVCNAKKLTSWHRRGNIKSKVKKTFHC